MEHLIPFDWPRLFLDDAPWLFLAEIAVRSVAGYLLVLGALRISGRRGVGQLSLFELSVVLALGSAAGDVMLYQDTAVLPAVVVFVVVMALYTLFNRLTEWFPKFSDWLEGRPVRLMLDGAILHEAMDKQNLTQKELFSQLRLLQVEHLGQIRCAYIEATGRISVFFYADADVRPGLPIFPELLRDALKTIAEPGAYACTICGYVAEWEAGAHQCPVCGNACWLPASEAKRVA